MFSRIATFALAALPILAAATPLAVRGGDSCSTGPIQCCNQTATTNSASGSAILALLGINAQDVDALIGLQCTPITVIGVATGNSCNAHAVCCTNNNVGGLVSLGCVPVSLS
ncbi:fungal hydrophobin [Cubamyces sp. BRFM 1775]|nr:fungal hydrophobin [Cubamyces sp. BRFM 1775]